MEINPVMDSDKAGLIRYLRAKAHMYSSWIAPQVSKDAEALNACADALEESDTPPKSEFDRLMK